MGPPGYPVSPLRYRPPGVSIQDNLGINRHANPERANGQGVEFIDSLCPAPLVRMLLKRLLSPMICHLIAFPIFPGDLGPARLLLQHLYEIFKIKHPELKPHTEVLPTSIKLKG